MSSVSRRAGALVVLLALVTGLATVGVAQRGEDARNQSPEFFEAVDGAPCFNCHSGEGFRPMAFGILTRFTELPIGEPTDIRLQVQHAGKMPQELRDIGVTIDVSQAPNVNVLVDGFVPEVAHALGTTLTHDTPRALRFEVDPGAVSIEAMVAAESNGRPYDVAEELHMAVIAPGGARFDGSGEGLQRSVTLEETQLAGLGTGDFHVELRYEHPVAEMAARVEAEGQVVVTYGQEQTRFRFAADDPEAIRGADPADRRSRIVTIPVVIRSEDPALLDFRAEAVNFFLHEKGDSPGDEGLFYRFDTMHVKGGDTAVQVSGNAAPVPLGPTVDLFTLFTRILGFVTLLLVPMAMVTGGLFGKASRRWLNRVAGGAKKRVLWHNAMSFIIIGVASLHFVLALLEPGMAWTTGLFWGGVGWAVLVSLGFTGWYQVRMIRRWNYRTWRRVHLWSAVGVFVFGALHMVLDGSDLVALRNMLPDWHRVLIWP